MANPHGVGDQSLMACCPVCQHRISLSQTSAADRPPHYPFCSERCKLIDLGAWLDEDYVIQSGPDSNESQISEPEPYEES